MLLIVDMLNVSNNLLVDLDPNIIMIQLLLGH